MAVAMLLLVFAGFAPTFFLSYWLEPDPFTSAEPIFYLHGGVLSAWMMLLVVQPALITLQRAKVHRRLGWWGSGLAVGVVVMGILAGLAAAARPEGAVNPPKSLEFLCVMVFGIFVFTLLVGLAIAFRHDSQYHKRFMILATINLLQPAIVRTPLHLPGDFGAAETFLLAEVFILPLVVWDLAMLRRIHPATLWGGLTIVASLPFRFWVSETETWLAIAAWAVGLV
ncbi:MAG: hypothetical protein O7E57_13075 [Gammaproteobacteria bacterium]|nr:hypothetical protein [Gammaproteobacteria bacterium]